MSRVHLQNVIIKEGSCVLSATNYDAIWLLCRAFDMLNFSNIRTPLKAKIADVLGIPLTTPKACTLHDDRKLAVKPNYEAFWVQEVVPFLNSLSPKGFCFWYKPRSRDFVGWVREED